MLTRSFSPPEERAGILAYSPMLHARLFADSQKYRDQHFQPTRRRRRSGQLASSPADPTRPTTAEPTAIDGEEQEEPYLDGNPSLDRPLIVQFCANDPDTLLAAARLVAPHCDAVDLNLGCPQGIARKGRYGAFLQEDQDLIFRMVRTLHENLPVPVTAKIRILDTREATLAYAQNVLAAGASFLTVHGRRREQKGHLTGLADWAAIRYLREQLPPETVLFANGNVLQPADLARCLAATGADAVMSAEANLSDPGLFAARPPPGAEGREYWRPADGRPATGGWRVDAVARRYLDILHRYVLGTEPPARRPLFVPGDDIDEAAWSAPTTTTAAAAEDGEPLRKKRKGAAGEGGSVPAGRAANIPGLQAHLFHLLRHFVARHTDVRDALARAPRGGMPAYEAVLAMVERKVAAGLVEYERTGGEAEVDAAGGSVPAGEDGDGVVVDVVDDPDCSTGAVNRCRRPWWVVQPIVRPLPKEAVAKGAVVLSKKQGKRAREQEGGEVLAAPVDKTPGPGEGESANLARGGGEGAAGPVATLEDTTNFQQSGLVSG